MQTDDDLDLRIVMPDECRVNLGSIPDLLMVNNIGVWHKLRRLRNGHGIFFMSAIDPAQHPGLAAMVRDEQYAALRECDLVQADLAYWEKPYRVDDDWCSPGFLTEHGDAALDAFENGYCWSIKNRCISQDGTRKYYRHILRWNEESGLRKLDKITDVWMVDLRQCVDPVRKGYQFGPLIDAIDMDQTIKHYMPRRGGTFLRKSDFETVRAMNDPRMNAVLTRMSWLIMTSEPTSTITPFGMRELGWVIPEELSLTFD